MVGEIGGDEEERTAEYIAEHVTKPVVAYIAGLHRRRPASAWATPARSSPARPAPRRRRPRRSRRRACRVGRNPTEVARIAAEKVGAKA